MARTQDHLQIIDIHDDLVALKDGSVAMVLECGAVNFDLLSEREQLAIIDSFAGFLNSLSFAVQIIIRSQRLDISDYLKVLDGTLAKQQNPLLQQMMAHYRSFIAQTIKENEVLDKQFYMVILASYLELGIIKNKLKDFKKATTILIPRRDHVIRQFLRIGLKVTQLPTDRLIKLFYDIYNESAQQNLPKAAVMPAAISATIPQVTIPAVKQPLPTPPATPPNQAAYLGHPQSSAPYVVEELPDDYGYT